MSLMPSESAHFSDLLGRGLDASKKSKWRAPTLQNEGSEANRAAPLDPVAPAQTFQPAVHPPQDQVQSAPASPASQWDGAPGPLSAGPIEGVLPQPFSDAVFEQAYPPAPNAEARPAFPLDANAILAALAGAPSAAPMANAPSAAPMAVAPEPRPPLHFQSAASAHDPEEFGFPEPTVAWPSLLRRRRNRMIRFMGYEIVALAILVVSAVMGIAHRLPDDPLSLVAKIVTIASAVAVVGIPILFYGLPDTLPTSRR